MRIIVCPANAEPHIENIANELRTMQEIVGGYIEPVRITEDVALIVNEEGRIQGLPENKSCPFHGLVGDCFFVGVTGDEFCSLGSASESFFFQEACKRWKECGASS